MEKLITINYRVTEKVDKQIQELADKKRWSKAEVSLVAMENLLKAEKGVK